MEENEILARQMAAAAAEHAARDEALERRLAEAEAALERFRLAAEAQAEARAAAGFQAAAQRDRSSPSPPYRHQRSVWFPVNPLLHPILTAMDRALSSFPSFARRVGVLRHQLTRGERASLRTESAASL